MNRSTFPKAALRSASVVSIIFLFLWPARGFLSAQAPPAGSQFTPEQLDHLVAPVAAYPEALLGQVFLAATHPLQVLAAQQWLRQNPRLQGLALINAAQPQRWDTSVQVLLLFPDVLGPLASDIRRTSALGSVFLTQRDEVIGAVERMRARVRAPSGGSNAQPY